MSIFSTIGKVAGSAFGGPVGLLAGGAVGNLVGDFFGGNKQTSGIQLRPWSQEEAALLKQITGAIPGLLGDVNPTSYVGELLPGYTADINNTWDRTLTDQTDQAMQLATRGGLGASGLLKNNLAQINYDVGKGRTTDLTKARSEAYTTSANIAGQNTNTINALMQALQALYGIRAGTSTQFTQNGTALGNFFGSAGDLSSLAGILKLLQGGVGNKNNGG